MKWLIYPRLLPVLLENLFCFVFLLLFFFAGIGSSVRFRAKPPLLLIILLLLIIIIIITSSSQVKSNIVYCMED